MTPRPYHLSCMDCPNPTPRAFISDHARREHLEEHRRATGHHRWHIWAYRVGTAGRWELR